jgi:1,4-dihydroxy-2-naphthoyl-CoA synthase
MARAIDRAGIHFRILNASKGPAVRATRAQADRQLYKRAIRELLDAEPNLTLLQQNADDLILDGARVRGVVTQTGIRIAAESASIAFLFSRVGLAGADMGAAWLLPRIVGMAHASELLLLGEFVSAERAAAIGLYNRVVPDERLMPEAMDVAASLARGPSRAYGVTKQALNTEAAMDLVSAIEWEARAQAECMRHPNFREAYEAFRDRREPKFE